MAIISEQKYIGLSLTIVSITISILGWISILNIHYIKTNSSELLKNHFSQIENSLKGHQKVYLQAIPDPYFYLKQSDPNKTLLEFIPGELEIPSQHYSDTIASQDAFVFYREDLINQTIRTFLSEHPDWIREEINIPVPSQHWYSFGTIIYKKPR
ncbi:hypothetical protein LPTSP4_30470 [Leptospira ryugenii]|uniref:Uncharacterized protein n=2 Tax=Leptospira ryugenii TaxID=1917863 RepID=A0A2P2E3S2_9LEPT|nr:hypothetical protein LPTSP4_30470 [Leptospira ryugenii]